jgi:hypothetical protein
VIVVGSEGRGISGPVRKRLDLSVRIPMRGKLASLNASVAGSLLLFAAASQRPAGGNSGTVDAVEPQSATTADEPDTDQAAGDAEEVTAAVHEGETAPEAPADSSADEQPSADVQAQQEDAEELLPGDR